jgi:spore cortex protein
MSNILLLMMFRGGFDLNRRKWITIPVATLFVLTVAGCAGNNRADVKNRYNDNARPIGYYSNENHPNQSPRVFTDNDGPITEMADHSLGDEGRNTNIKTRNINNSPPNPFFDKQGTVPNRNDNATVQRNNRIPAGTNKNGEISDQIRKKAASVSNVRDVRSVVYGSNVYISVQLLDKTRAKQTKQAIRKAVRPYTDGRAVTVITEEGTFDNEQNINNDLQESRAR